MKVLTFSRHFPKGHPKAGQPTCFVNKVWNSFRREDNVLPASYYQWVKKFPMDSEEYAKAVNSILMQEVKHHTIRAGSRWKAGDMASLRVWSDKPYRSKQVEFAQVEVKKVWPVEIYATEFIFEVKINDYKLTKECQELVANNDGLNLIDFYNWFTIHPKKVASSFRGQIICWSDKIEY
jgi:hypothetical protein